MSDQPEVVTQSMTLIQPLLGLTPYTLIEMREASDGSGEPALFVQAGGGAQEDPMTMPLVAITEQRAEDSTVAQMLHGLAQQDHLDRSTLESVTREFNPDWVPFVLGS